MNQLLVIQTPEEMVKRIHRGQVLKIKLEVDTDPPPGFETHACYVLQPIPFAVRCYVLPDLFAGKMHAILCRRWKRRVKGRDWFDLVWYAANHPELHSPHLEQRLRQSGDWKGNKALDPASLHQRLNRVIDELDANQARREVAPFARHPEALEVWSREFFRDVAGRIRIV
jgi:hypothetical protein